MFVKALISSNKVRFNFSLSFNTFTMVLLSTQIFRHNPKHIVTIPDLILRSDGGN